MTNSPPLEFWEFTIDLWKIRIANSDPLFCSTGFPEALRGLFPGSQYLEILNMARKPGLINARSKFYCREGIGTKALAVSFKALVDGVTHDLEQ